MKKNKAFIKMLLSHDTVPVTIGIAIIVLIFSILSDGRFISFFNITNILKNSSVLAIAAVGSTFVILTGQNDISIGSVMSVSGIVTALLLDSGTAVFPAVLAGLFTGLFFGTVNGIVIAYFKANFWVATFAVMGIAGGLSLVLCDGRSISGFPDSFRFIASQRVLGIYLITLIAVAIYIACSVMLTRTRFGCNIYSVGNSENAAEISGINISRLRFRVYLLSGFFAGAAGILLAAKSNTAIPSAGSGYEFDAIAAVIIGGSRFSGGKGTLYGTLTGVLLITILRNGLSTLGVSSIWQYMLIGMIIMLIIVADTLIKDRKRIRSTAV